MMLKSTTVKKLVNKTVQPGFMGKYIEHVRERKHQGLPPLPLSASQVEELISDMCAVERYNRDNLIHILHTQVPPGVDDAAKVKAEFLHKIVQGKDTTIPKNTAWNLLSWMQGGYNIEVAVKMLQHSKKHDELDKHYIASTLTRSILIFDYFYDIEEAYKKNDSIATYVMQKWADNIYLQEKRPVPEKIAATFFKVDGEVTTDDLSPAGDVNTRPDIPLHAKSMLKIARKGVVPDVPGKVGPLSSLCTSDDTKLCFVSDVLGTGSARKSATNSLLWHIGEDVPFYPGKRSGGIVVASNIAPIFYNTLRDSGSLIIKTDVSSIKMNQKAYIMPYDKVIKDCDGKTIAEFDLDKNILNEVKAGGRINMILANNLQKKALDVVHNEVQKKMSAVSMSSIDDKVNRSYSLAQKIVGKACGKNGIVPGESVLPKVTTVGSQDASGPMTRSELKELACLGFTAPFVLQSFCHTAAYPSKYDLEIFDTLPKFIRSRGGVNIKPGDGIIHSWLNRTLLPDTVGTGGDSHTRFPIGISFPGGSNLVAFAAATGTMPLDMPESVLVRFKGQQQNGVTIRDLVHSIPYYAIKQGLLTVDKQNKKNVFNGRILEIEGLETLDCYQAFEFTDASAERCASACTFNHNIENVVKYTKSNVELLEWMIKEGYTSERSLMRRIEDMNKWLNNPTLLKRDDNLDEMFYKVIDIDLTKLREPVLCKPNDPDSVSLLSDIPQERVDEVFIGSCMTTIQHFRVVGEILKRTEKISAKLWMAPPTKMDMEKLEQEGYYDVFRSHGINLEIPGCSLCMGNQARVADNSTVVSTSTRNFPNRLGKDSNVYLASVEMAIISAIYGKIPSVQEYMEAL